MSGLTPDSFDIAIIGGGIIGLATARALLSARKRSLVVLEAEDRLAAHQSGRNSGVIHAGLYYRPGSLKARLCVEGREALYRFCRDKGVAHERCGKLVVATNERERAGLGELRERGQANGLKGLRLLSAEELREHEPHAAGVGGLHVAETGIVDFGAVVRALADDVRAAGGEIRTGSRVGGVGHHGRGLVVESSTGPVRCTTLINCAGLQADRVARRCGVRTDCQIVPFRGEYRRLAPDRSFLVRNLIYPVPDSRMPFLGVHLTRRIGPDGENLGIEAGPSAVLALDRHGYHRWQVSGTDLFEMLAWGGFWRMAARHWPTGLAELRRSLSRAALARQVQRLVPEVRASDLRPAESGVRAQAVAANGQLLDDFRIERSERAIHVLNAPSPAATASLSIGRYIANLVDNVRGRAARSEKI